MSGTGMIRNIGISGYDLLSIVKLARLMHDHLGRALDAVQVWAQLSLQNSTLVTNPQYGLTALRDAGIKSVFSSSPLAAGLLRNTGGPVGALGDWHPAPQCLHNSCAIAAKWLHAYSQEANCREEDLASLALRYAVAQAWHAEQEVVRRKIAFRTVVGVSSIDDLEANVKAARMILKPTAEFERPGIASTDELDENSERRDTPLFIRIQKLLGT